MTRKELKLKAKSQLQGNWGSAIFGVLIIFIIESCLNLLSGMVYSDSLWNLLITLITFIIYIPLCLGMATLFLKIARKEEVGYSDVFLGYKNIWKVIGVTILSSIIIFLGYICFVVPGIILSYMYSQIYFVLADNPNIGIVECLRQSREIMVNEKLNFFVLELSFILWMLLVVFTFGIASIYVIPYYETVLANFYIDIKSKKIYK